jgi:hypothetical protein
MFAALVLASLGQFRQCQTAASYRQQAAVTYAAPAYQQTYSYAASYAKPYVEAYFAPVYEDAYYTQVVGQQVRAELRAREELKGSVELTQQVANLSAQVGQLAARIGGVAPQPPPGPPLPPGKPLPDPPPDDGSVPPPPPVPPPVLPPPNPGPGASGPDAAVMGILTAQCAKCHTAPAKAGKGFVLFAEPGRLANLGPLDLLLIDSQVYGGAMPKDGDQMSTDDYSKLRAWISGSQPAIEAALKECKTKR